MYSLSFFEGYQMPAAQKISVSCIFQKFQKKTAANHPSVRRE
jgi:hypothetical protein